MQSQIKKNEQKAEEDDSNRKKDFTFMLISIFEAIKSYCNEAY